MCCFRFVFLIPFGLIMLSDAPGRDMMVVGIAGSHGKTTVSWLICGILEAMEQVTGG